ncbi:hypothetical protein CVT24_004950 [Panaeolus cyanescens]|uniref:Uncharacterized protein n=1 Tax=Panaeolus cyanescens TaxID=181874 RepID=A0A409YB74_9AGAR|nr:hypothetical protein CVT24_004950 [Panaeolus cyanescens]
MVSLLVSTTGPELKAKKKTMDMVVDVDMDLDGALFSLATMVHFLDIFPFDQLLKDIIGNKDCHCHPATVDPPVIKPEPPVITPKPNVPVVAPPPDLSKGSWFWNPEYKPTPPVSTPRVHRSFFPH